jgi:hypothetical protein
MVVIISQALAGEAPWSRMALTDLTREEICNVGSCDVLAGVEILVGK